MKSERVKSRRKWGRFAVIVALLSGMVLVLSGTSSALSDEEMADEVLLAVLRDRGIELDDGPLRVRLDSEIREAIRIGAVLWDTLNELGFRWNESFPEGSTPSPDSFPGETLRERLRERFEEQLRIWSVVAPEWREAFEQLRERVRECRETNDEKCWLDLRLRLQFEHAQRFQEMFENRYQEMRENGGPVSDLAEMERLRERTEERIRSMIENGERSGIGDSGVAPGDLEQLREQLRDQSQVHLSIPTSSTTTTSPTTSNPDTSAGGPGSTMGDDQSGQGGN